jgi:hypothetical protein
VENVPDYQLKFEKHVDPNGRSTRSTWNSEAIEPGMSKIGTFRFMREAVRAWNKNSKTLKDIASVYSAKKEIGQTAVALPF